MTYVFGTFRFVRLVVVLWSCGLVDQGSCEFVRRALVNDAAEEAVMTHDSCVMNE